METHKIKKKYCTKNKVQVMFSNAQSQIIFSKDGYLYLRDSDITIHRYLSDSERKKMPYRNHPSSKSHANHLFKYDTIYAKFTRHRNMNPSWFYEDSFSLTFLYFHKIQKGEVICAEMNLEDFEKETKTEIQTFNKQGVLEFLYAISGLRGKYIFDFFNGILYAKSVNEQICIDKSFLELSDESIIKLYNSVNEPLEIFYRCKNNNWKTHTIENIKDFNITNHGFTVNYPIMLTISDDEINVYEFEIIFCSKDCYKIKSRKTKIIPNLVEILSSAINSDYTIEPSFKE